MAPGLSKDIQCHVWQYFSKLANHQIRHQATHKDCQPMIAYGHFNLPGGFVWYVWVNILTLSPQGGEVEKNATHTI